LFDLHGNVWEWCEDRYWTYSAARAVDPVGAQEDTRVARGGSWADTPERLRAANRIALRPDMRTLYVGMRLVIDAEWPKDAEPRRPGSEE
jgi:formylglycine-generating enzyme required for sulfatase activity